jgi:hypothetical protein
VKKPVWLGLLFMALVLGYLVYSTVRAPKFRCRVCIVFNGKRDCRTASAETRENAERAAITNACALIAGGVTETRLCEITRPESIEWLE